MQSAPLGSPWTTPGPAKTNGTSVFALVASLSGFVCFAGIGGALGIVLGLVARNEIGHSEGRETGRGLATAAIVVGVLNVACTVIGLAAAITFLARPKPNTALRGRPVPTATAWRAPTPPPSSPHATAKPPNAPSARASHEAGTRVTTLGAITLADISGDLGEELDKQRRAAVDHDELLVLWLVVPNCKPCDGVAASLTHPLTQKALAGVRLVRADRDEFQGELERLGIPTEKIPGFALLDTHNRPRDFIHGGEWDADIAANIAPVLGKFAHGSYVKRRHPWHGAPRDDETPL